MLCAIVKLKFTTNAKKKGPTHRSLQPHSSIKVFQPSFKFPDIRGGFIDVQVLYSLHNLPQIEKLTNKTLKSNQ
jgi:hypothetical protein